MKDVYQLSGISKQAYHQAQQDRRKITQISICYIGLIMEVRQIHPGMGLREIYENYHPEGIGRDAFIEIGKAAGLIVKTKVVAHRTTYSIPNNLYNNLLLEKKFTDVNQIWTSDITYYKLGAENYYIVLIMDVYSRRIVGYSIAKDMRALNNVKALKMALKLRNIQHYDNQLIHHSDRGAQYIAYEYTQLLQSSGIAISMCTSVFENTHIERVNGTIKNYYLNHWAIPDEKTLFRKVENAVNNYNNRPHQSLNKMTPIEFELYLNELCMENRTPLSIFTIDNKMSNFLQLELELVN